MAAELDQLDELVARLRRVDAIGTAIAEEALPEVLAEAQRTAAAGTTPEGKPWPTKKDGTRALPNAAGAVRAVVSGASYAVLTLILSGAYVFHHRAKKKGRRREILPTPAEGIPEAMHGAIGRAAKRVIGRELGGGR